MVTNIALLIATALAALFFLQPRLLRLRGWRATVTPLASIIGSGFLVVAPILADTVGRYAWLAMIGLCLVGYFYGAAIRHNISQVEPNLGQLSPLAARIEQGSDLMLALSYFISVAYYLNLFAAFGLRIIGVEEQLPVRLLASLTIAIIGLIGFRGGLSALERLEVGAVGLKLSVISGLMLSLAMAFMMAGSHPATIASEGHKSPADALKVVLGLIILVQGFETSRYLSAEYDARLRIRTMRWAQWIASAIYVAFVFMVTNLFGDAAGNGGGETAVIDMLRPLGSAAAPLLIMAALASQSSAAVADMNGAGGLINEASKHKIAVKFGNLCTALVAIAISWSANIFEIITWASKAFVAYYALQSLQAALSAKALGQPLRALGFACGVVLAVVIVIWAVPADV